MENMDDSEKLEYNMCSRQNQAIGDNNFTHGADHMVTEYKIGVTTTESQLSRSFNDSVQPLVVCVDFPKETAQSSPENKGDSNCETDLKSNCGKEDLKDQFYGPNADKLKVDCDIFTQPKKDPEVEPEKIIDSDNNNNAPSNKMDNKNLFVADEKLKETSDESEMMQFKPSECHNKSDLEKSSPVDFNESCQLSADTKKDFPQNNGEYDGKVERVNNNNETPAVRDYKTLMSATLAERSLSGTSMRSPVDQQFILPHQKTDRSEDCSMHVSPINLPKLVPITTIGPRMQFPQMTAVVRPITPSNITLPSRNRTRFSSEMVNYLEKHYMENKYPTGIGYKEIAHSLGLEWTKVKVWFQNRRSKENRVKKLSNLETTYSSSEILQKEVSKTAAPRKRRKLNSGKSKITKQSESQVNYSKSIRMWSPQSYSENVLNQERNIGDISQFVGHNQNQVTFPPGIFGNPNRKSSVPPPLLSVVHGQNNSGTGPSQNNNNGVSNVNSNNNSHMPSSHLTPEVMQLTHQLDSSQLMNTNGSNSSSNNTSYRPALASSVPQIMQAGQVHPGMWQSFCYGSSAAASQVQNVKAQTPNVQPTATAAGVMFPPIVQQMLIGMQPSVPLYMLPTNPATGTVLDLTKKSHGNALPMPVLTPNAPGLQRDGCSSSIPSYWNPMCANGHSSNDVSQFNVTTYDCNKMQNNEMKWRPEYLKQVEQSNIGQNFDGNRNRYNSNYYGESPYSYEDCWNINPPGSTHRRSSPSLDVATLRVNSGNQGFSQPPVFCDPCNPFARMANGNNQGSVQYVDLQAAKYTNISREQEVQQKMGRPVYAKLFGSNMKPPSAIGSSDNLPYTSETVSTWVAPPLGVYQSTCYAGDGSLKPRGQSNNSVPSQTNPFIGGLVKNFTSSQAASLEEFRPSRNFSVPQNQGIPESVARNVGTESECILPNKFTDNQVCSIQAHPHVHSPEINETNKHISGLCESIHSQEKTRTNEHEEQQLSYFSQKYNEQFSGGVPNRENSHHQQHLLDSGIGLSESSVNRQQSGIVSPAVPEEQETDSKNRSGINKAGMEILSDNYQSNRYLPSLAAYSMSDFVNKVSPIFLSRPNTPSPPLCTSTPVKNRSMEGCSSEEDTEKCEDDSNVDEKKLRELNTPPLHFGKKCADSSEVGHKRQISTIEYRDKLESTCTLTPSENNCPEVKSAKKEFVVL